MPYVAYGSPRDKQYRRAIEADNNQSGADNQTLLVSPSPFGNSTSIYFPDDVRNRNTPTRVISSRAQYEVYQRASIAFLTSPSPFQGSITYLSDNLRAEKGVKNAKTYIASRSEFEVYDGSPNFVLTSPTPYGLINYDWPVPKGPKFFFNKFTNLRSKPNAGDTMFGMPGQVDTYDWQLPKPKAARRYYPDLSDNGLNN